MVMNMQIVLFSVIALIILTIVLVSHVVRNVMLSIVSSASNRFCSLLTFGFIIGSFNLSAQYIPSTSQVFQLAPVYNPAFTGVDRFGDLRLGYRKQLSEFEFFNMSYNFQLKKPVDLKQHGIRTGLGDKVVLPKSKQIIMGGGVHVFNEKIGPIARTGGGITYSLNLVVSEKFRFASGLGVFFEKVNVNGNELYWGENPGNYEDPVYKSLANGDPRSTHLNARIGVLLYSNKFYIGGAYLPLVQSDLSKSEVAVTGDYYMASLQTGVMFPLGPESSLKPSINALLLDRGTLILDYNVKLYLKDRTWLGATYRSVEFASVSFGLNVSRVLSVAYSYEFPTANFQGMGGNSQDVLLSIRLNNFRKENSLLW